MTTAKQTPTLQLFAVCVVIWGTTWLAITYQLGHVAEEISVGYRFMVAAAALFAYCTWKKIPLKFSAKQHGDFVLLGAAMFCISYIFVYYAETYIISGMVAVAYSASPMINMLGARLFFGTPMTRRVVVASLFGVAGIVAVFWHEFSHISDSRNAELGIILTILSVIASSAGSMAATRNAKFGYNTWASMAWSMLYGGLLSLVVGVAMGKPFTVDLTAGYFLSLVYLAIAGSVITFGCYLTLIGRIGPAKAGYVGVMVPIVALVVSFFFEKFAWGWLTTVGVALSVVGNVVMLRKGK